MKKFPSVDYKALPPYRDVKPEEWNDWHWQLKNRIRDVETLGEIIELDDKEKEDVKKCLGRFRMAITPYYASLMDREYRLCSVRLQAVPSVRETAYDEDDMDDPLHEDLDSPAPGVIHRYPDRVLFLVTNRCSMYCRHCTRRRLVGSEDHHLTRESLEAGLDYIRKTPEVRDVLLSGGDPLVMSDEAIDWILGELRKIEHVEIVRIGTRTPVVMPQRITESLVKTIRRHHPVFVNTHFNHYKEITEESARACAMLADGGVPLGNQSVLLRDVNDCPRIMKRLVQDLLAIRVKPYYIYQCDLSRGISHFRTSIAKGIEIIENLRGHTTGMAVPTFVVDAPGGGGKIPLMPDYILSWSDKRVVLRNYEGVITSYSQPENVYSECWCELCRDALYEPLDGVAKCLIDGKRLLEPAGLQRRHPPRG